MTEEEFTTELNLAVGRFLERNNIRTSTGPSHAFDHNNTTYITLSLEGEVGLGCPRVCIYNKLEHRMITTFLLQLEYWLKKRNWIVWRDIPRLVIDTQDCATVIAREAIQDGIAPPGALLPFVQKSYWVSCRLTAYGDPP